MFKETIDCIDAGSEYCPCHLAESDECILCSQLHGSCFCDCSNWKGVCIYHEFKDNGDKAKEGRKTFNCLVTDKVLYEKDVLLIKFKSPHKLAIDLVRPGSYIFIRTDSNVYFDIPISILESDIETNIITIMIEIRGIKTKKLLEIEKGGEITIRGPYWNGVFGLKNIQKPKDKNVLIIARGIGMAPMVPVVKKFSLNNNKVYLLLDKEPYKDNYVKEYLYKYGVTPIFINAIDKGYISVECKSMINKFISEENISNIHIAGADILTYKVIDYMDEINNSEILLSCCNNTKMCCGEGICGSCTTRFSGGRVKRFCKVQADPRNVFEGRRFI